MARRRTKSPRKYAPLRARFWVVACLVLAATILRASGEEAALPPASPRAGRTVEVPLPLTGSLDIQVLRAIDEAVDSLPADGSRPVLILEFRPAERTEGEGTDLDRANKLARHLVSEKLSRVRTVAWVPQSIRGHALLPVLACEEIIMAPAATLGDAGHDEKQGIDAGMVANYEFIAQQRRTIPRAVVRGLLDKQLAVSKVQTLDGAQYVLADELAELQKKAAVKSVETVKDPGQPAIFTGSDLRLKHSFVSHLAADRSELAAALKLPARAVERDAMLGGDAVAVLVRLDGPIRGDKVNFITRALDQRLQQGDVNFVCVEVDSAGGSLADSARLAQYLSELDARGIRTVAFVPRQARGDAALIAVACDQLVMTGNARLGGPGEGMFDPVMREDVRAIVRQLGQSRSRNWSLAWGLVDPSVTVFRYLNEQDQRVAYFTDEELQEQANPAVWKKTGQAPTSGGITGNQADELRLSHAIVDERDALGELQRIYHLDSEPERLQANWAHLLIEQLARPEISGFLLFVAFFALMFELMTPGLGLPGFIAAVCFLLFFWAKVLYGTAGTLEIVLFVGGIAFVCVEIFALPGFGIFGIGGVTMIIASVILASQTFVIPRNAYQLEQLPTGLLMVTAAGAGVIISLVIFRKYMHKAPLLNRMLLAPPETGTLSQREAIVSFDHLLHKRGVTLTPLTPAGKARFGDDYIDVVSDGDFLPRDANVYVIEIAGNRVVVRAVE